MFVASWVLASAALLGEPAAEEEKKEEPPATWRFTQKDKNVKVVLLAGSVGAHLGKSYLKELRRMCVNVETKNLSKIGYGAYPLKQYFRKQVLQNRRLNLEEEGKEYWMIYGGGINSVGMPQSTNHHIKATIVAAKHFAKMKVVGLTVTPWGDEKDKRWRGVKGLGARKNTKLVADYIMKRLTPKQALGSYAAKRPAGAEADWVDLEVPDISVDLYDSGLRDKDASPRDLEKMRAALAKDYDWKRKHKSLTEEERAAALEADAQMLSDLPKWYMKKEYRSFDHIHPNNTGHKIMADTICPKLPESWGCTCE